MQNSAEIRWFWNEARVAELETWFHSTAVHGCAAGGGALRIDEYLVDPGTAELGIKRRGGKRGVEVKGLVRTFAQGISIAPFVGSIQEWAKWTTEALDLGVAVVSVEKRRWIRKYACEAAAATQVPLDSSERPTHGVTLPESGCNVELTAIRVDNAPWWTLGFEAFGPPTELRRNLLIVAELLAERTPPSLSGGDVASYPEWLRRRTTGQ